MQPLTSTRTCTHTQVHTHTFMHTDTHTYTRTGTHAQEGTLITYTGQSRSSVLHPLGRVSFCHRAVQTLCSFFFERTFNKLPRSPCLASLSLSRSPLASGTLILPSAMEADFPAPGNGHEHAVACLPGCPTNAKPHGNTWSHGYSPSIEGETEAQRVQSRVKGQSIWGCFCGKKTRKHEFSSS